MIEEIIKEISSNLPLLINEIKWNDPSLELIGDGWNFSTLSSWRIVNTEKLICGCYDKDSNDELNKLKSFKIVLVDIKGNSLPINPVFVFSNNYKLEIFSTTFLEPWIFSFSSGTVYVSSPSNPSD